MIATVEIIHAPQDVAIIVARVVKTHVRQHVAEVAVRRVERHALQPVKIVARMDALKIVRVHVDFLVPEEISVIININL